MSRIYPLPHDIPLPLPANEMLLKGVLIVAFVLHILFVELMIGSAILALFYQIKSRKNPVYNQIAFVLIKTITVNKSLAVVLGVAPLLAMNTVYTIWFYSANALTGNAWILVIPLVAIAFLLFYLHKYRWPQPIEQSAPLWHLAILILAISILLIVPLIFLANINLMLFPDQWNIVRGFVSSLFIGNVWFRYVHFLSQALLLTHVMLVILRSRYQKFILSFTNPQLDQALEHQWLNGIIIWTWAHLLSLWLLALSLPDVDAPLSFTYWSFSLVSILEIALLLWLWKQKSLKPNEPLAYFRQRPAMSLIFGICYLVSLLTYASGRHYYREVALAEHRKLIEQHTREYLKRVQAEQSQVQVENSELSGIVESSFKKGEELFQSCSACHALNERRVGPPLVEIAEIYKDNPLGIVQWAKAPGKKRADYPPMPPMPLKEEELKLIADYILQVVSTR